MKKYKSFILMGIMCAMLSSCEDFFSTTLDIDPPEHTKQLAVHAFGNTNDNYLKVSVTETVGLLEEVWNAKSINNAQVSLYKNDQLIYVLDNQNGIDNYLMPSGVHIYEKGATYRLEVVASDFPMASSETTIPEDVIPISVKFDPEVSSGFEGDDYSAIDILFQDDVNESNYYEFNAVNDPNAGPSSFYLFSESIDASVLRGIENLISEDVSYNGDEKNIEVLINKIESSEANQWLYLAWRITSEGHYLFNKTAAIQNNSDDNPFAGPVQGYTNFTDGIGIFSITNQSIIKVQL